MTVTIAKADSPLTTRPYWDCACTDCERSMSFAQEYSAQAWQRRHEAECTLPKVRDVEDRIGDALRRA